MTNEQLVTQIKAGENTLENMEALYFQMRRFIHAVAWTYKGGGELDDLEQEGFLALYDAVKNYNPDAGRSFLSYAGEWINSRMRRYIGENAPLRLPVHESASEPLQALMRGI